MQRRELLRATICGLLGPIGFRSRASLASGSGAGKGKTALVIGAGIAGLAAARRLSDHGFSVVVLESRQRIGGRVWTDRSWGTPIELGASWLEQEDVNPLKLLANQSKLELTPSNLESMALYDHDGARFDDDEVEELLEDFDDLMGRIEAMAQRIGTDISLGEAARRAISPSPLSAVDRRELEWALSIQVWDSAAELDRLSLRHFDPNIDSEAEDLTVGGGFDRLIEQLAKGLQIRQGQDVSRIEYDAAGVRVFAGSTPLAADLAVVTVPIGVLKSNRIAFRPELPQRKRAAIEKLEMGLLNKVALRYPRRFWPADKEFLGYMPREGAGFRHFVNLPPSSGEPILTAFAAGDHARDLERRDDRDIVAAAHETLQKMFGNRIPQPAGFRVTRWGADRFAFGSYSYVPLGGSGRDYDALAEPVLDRLLFAGEATHRQFPATVHGAYLSGLREAERAARWAAQS